MPDPEMTAKDQESVHARRSRLMGHLQDYGLIQNKSGQLGGYMANVKHLVGYNWDAVAWGMLFEDVYLLLALIFGTPLLHEKVAYQNMPDEFKIDLENYDPDVTPVYAYSTAGGKVTLDFNRVLTQEEITPLDLVANGYMYTPDVGMAYRRRWNEWNEAMVGHSRDSEWDILFDVAQGKRHDTPANEDIGVLNNMLLNPARNRPTSNS